MSKNVESSSSRKVQPRIETKNKSLGPRIQREGKEFRNSSRRNSDPRYLRSTTFLLSFTLYLLCPDL